MVDSELSRSFQIARLLVLAPVGTSACTYGPRVLSEAILHDNPSVDNKLTSKIAYLKWLWWRWADVWHDSAHHRHKYYY